MMKGAETASSFFTGDSTNRTELIASLGEGIKTSDDDLKAFLGESRYALYQDYQMTVGDRLQLSQFVQMNGDNPVTDQQTEQLLNIIKEERQSVGASTGQTFSGDHGKEDLEAMISDEQLDKLLKSQQSVNERVYLRAFQVLSPDQMQNFGRYQTNQLDM